ncbi:MAG: endonuclease/exonuclease/phosphatase family protein [Bacteroidaceae bacterium]|nr:endonuclease/exonuclease/phosphatase family protein [Bacteroidaceae bacterium]
MRKIVLSFVAFIAAIALTSGLTESNGSQEKRTVYAGVAFYNQENLFDTIHDEGKNDYDFLPNGSYHWGTIQYKGKLANMSRVLSELCTDRVKGGAAFIGLSEVENSRVLDDLISQPALASKGMRYIHFEGDDKRGIDVAALYNPKMFHPDFKKTRLVSVTKEYQEFSGGHITRGVLYVEGNLLGDKFVFLVNHWPSRGAASDSREFMGRIVRNLKDSVLNASPETKVVIMGDLNDDPDDKSIVEALGAKKNMKDVKLDTDIYNPWFETLRKKGQGTLLWDGMWNLFDQIIISKSLVGKDRSSFKFFKNEVYMPDYIVSKSGRTKGGPLRTTASGVWQNGFSDHFPTQIYFAKEIER